MEIYLNAIIFKLHVELKLGLDKENVFQLLYLAAVLLGAIIASFGKVALGGAVGIVLILAITAVSMLTDKE